MRLNAEVEVRTWYVLGFKVLRVKGILDFFILVFYVLSKLRKIIVEKSLKSCFSPIFLKKLNASDPQTNATFYCF